MVPNGDWIFNFITHLRYHVIVKEIFITHLVAQHMDKSGNSEDPEMPHGRDGVGPREQVEQTHEDKHWDILKVIQVVPVNRTHR